MYKWLTWFLTFIAGLLYVAPTEKDYVGVVAAAFAYATLLPDTAPVKPKVPQSECKTCGGTGRVRTGDDQSWTRCPDCEPDGGTGNRPVLKSTAPGFPARRVPSI